MNVFVGLSGGVDSAVSAALLKEQGHAVTGVFIRIYRPEFIECTWKEDRLDAMRVCAALNIPFREIDLSDEYKKGVIDGMIADYAAGITPNPDVLCNREIKFGAFLRWSREQGADKIATGHYARLDPPRLNLGGQHQLLRGKDSNKDQSYFLFRLTQAELKYTLFPVGNLTKPEVRAHAEHFNLPVAQKHDSQGLCFIGDVSIEDFLARYIPLSSGPVVDKQGREIGQQKGAALVTIGQRHGFSVYGAAAQAPHYVVGINVDTNTIVVSSNREDAAVREVNLRDISWTAEPPADAAHVDVQVRYREKTVGATLHFENNRIQVRFDEPHIAPPGQSLVMYKSDVCIGGGVIEKTG